jgi:hypothetical protein
MSKLCQEAKVDPNDDYKFSNIKHGSYLDNPETDDTPRQHPAFARGQAAGVEGAINVLKNAIAGADKGLGPVANPELQKIRSVIQTWREFLDENKDKNNYLSKKIVEVLKDTDHVL